MPLLRDGQGEKATTKQQKKTKKKGRKEHTTKVNRTILYMWNTLSRNRKKIHVTNEISHLLSEPSILANSFFLYHDKPLPLLRDGQGEKTQNKERVKK